MLLAHKIELYATEEQKGFLLQSIGCRRLCYNALLAHFKQEGVKWSKKAAYEYYKDIIVPQYPFFKDVSSRAHRGAIDDLDSAFKHFFRRCKAGEKPGFPTWAKRGINDSFSMREASKFDIRGNGRKLRLERLPTSIKLREKVRFSGKLKSVTISYRAGKFFASILVDTQDYVDQAGKGVVGVDFGVRKLATLSDGTNFESNRKLRNSLKKLKKLQRKLSCKKKGSNRRAKAKLKVAKLHYRIANQRQALLHEVSDYITANFGTIVLEDLNIKGMLKNHKLALSIQDAGLGELRRQIEYKAKLRGNNIIFVDRFYPSSKTCSYCGSVKNDLGFDEVYKCGNCGLKINRDLNAALNLKKQGVDTFKPTSKRTQELSKTSACRSFNVDGVNKLCQIV